MVGLGMQILCQLTEPPKEKPIKKYDERFKTKFHPVFMSKPDNNEYVIYNNYARENDFGEETPSLFAAVALADINLRTRNQIGIVLGSTVGELFSPPDDFCDHHNHRDFDVALLFALTHTSPKPFEWGIDWWVKPFRGLEAPTNGRVKLWYDLTLKENIKFGSCKYLPQAFELHGERFHFDPDAGLEVRTDVQEKVNKLIIHPGLYLPHPETMQRIIDHCNKRACQEGKYDYLSLLYKDPGRAVLPIMPHDALNLTLIDE